uniref:DUF7768 domain-containing protein n=1 Tax=viral metagenome TaxID=1070528 RepID=A0A6M3IEQ6_9ZZZZ
MRVYVAGPYRADTESGVRQNIERARAVAEMLWAKGYAVFCPHLNSAFMGGVAPSSTFLRGGLEWLAVSECLVVLDNSQDSEGTQAEVAEALRMGIPVLTESAGWLLHEENESGRLPPSST